MGAQYRALDGDDIQGLLAEGRCLRCRQTHGEISIETGFPEHFCYACRPIVEKEARARNAKPGAAAARRQHKEDGIANLDRLLGEAGQAERAEKVARLRALLKTTGTSKQHSEAVNVDQCDGKTYVSYRVTPEVKAEFEALRQGISDAEIVGITENKRRA